LARSACDRDDHGDRDADADGDLRAGRQVISFAGRRLRDGEERGVTLGSGIVHELEQVSLQTLFPLLRFFLCGCSGGRRGQSRAAEGANHDSDERE
jgi:hypothetical protein